MKRAGKILWSVGVAAVAGAIPMLAAAGEAPATPRELASLREAGKVTAAFWSRREDAFTLQLTVSPFIGQVIGCLRGLDPNPAFLPTAPRPLSVQASQAQDPLVPRTGLPEDRITYTFPLAGGEQAVAAAIQVDEGFHIERLR